MKRLVQSNRVFLRRISFRSDPLVRPIDRYEALLTLVLVVAAVAALPLTIWLAMSTGTPSVGAAAGYSAREAHVEFAILMWAAGVALLVFVQRTFVRRTFEAHRELAWEREWDLVLSDATLR